MACALLSGGELHL